MKTMLKIVVLGMLAASGAASATAETAGTSAGAAEGSGAQSAPTAARAAAKADKLCARMEPPTGTRISLRECKTKAEWETRGVELKEIR